MDVDLLRTFLEIVEAGHFVRAADRLNVTQSTVSARIKELEQRVGRPLFLRGRSGATLTPAGRHFLPHAAAMVRIWRQARQEAGLPPHFEAVLSVGGQYSLSDGLLRRWLAWMRKTAPEVALRAEIASSAELGRLLVEGMLDIAVLYAAQPRPGLRLEWLLDERLVLIAARAGDPRPGGDGYVFVDWGPEFRAAHAAAFPDIETPALTISLGVVALNYILEAGGGGYFPLRVVRDQLTSGSLARVDDAPEFTRPAYLAWQNRDDPVLDRAVQGLRDIAAVESG